MNEQATVQEASLGRDGLREQPQHAKLGEPFFWLNQARLGALYSGRAIGLALKIKNMSWVGLGLDLAKDYLMQKLDAYQRAMLLGRYQVDEVRRLYLASRELSSYKRIDPPSL